MGELNALDAAVSGIRLTARKDIHNSDIPVVCLACEARHRGVCGALTPEQLTRLSKHTTKTVHEREDPLVDPTKDQNTYANILSGVVKLTKLMSDGRQQIVGLQFAPDFMGRPFASETDISMDAATTVRLCSFPKSVLEEMLHEAPEMEHLLHQQALSELNEARDWLLTLGRKTALEKVASFLLLIATHIDPEEETDSEIRRIELPLRRSEIADFLGLTTETVSRQLTNLRKKDIIRIDDRRQITITSLKTLESISDQSA